MDFDKFEALTFDCYGTLIDWESGIVAALRPVISSHDLNLTDGRILELYAEAEAASEKGEYVSYREVLRRIVQQVGSRLGFEPSVSELDCLAGSLKDWAPFPDTIEALHALKRRYKLGIISNIDDDLFAPSEKRLGVEFDWVITSEQVKSYKPSLDNFRFAIDRIGLPSERVLHVAESIYHDIGPAKSLGLSTVWVDRSRGTGGLSATPRVGGQPDLEVTDLKGLVSIMGLNPQ